MTGKNPASAPCRLLETQILMMTKNTWSLAKSKGRLARQELVIRVYGEIKLSANHNIFATFGRSHRASTCTDIQLNGIRPSVLASSYQLRSISMSLCHFY